MARRAIITRPLGKDPVSGAALRRLLWPIILLGFLIGILLFGSLAVWASRAPLASAAIASGNVSPDSSRQVIQHYEGGIVKEIRVADGQTVKKGDVLYSLEPLQARAQYDAKRNQWMRLEVTRARLEAHMEDRATFEPPSFKNAVNDPSFDVFVTNQVALFEARRRAFSERDQILRQQILQLNQQAEAKRRENESLTNQRQFLEEEIADKKELFAKNLARKPEWLALERARAEVMGRTEANLAELARISERTAEIRLSIVTNRTQFNQEISDQLARVNTDLSQLKESVVASEDVLKRTEVIAPLDGTVFNLRIKTVGGVVRPGDPLLDLVPADDDLIIDARLSPNDIDVVRTGMRAEVYLVPYVARYLPRLNGTVVRVSPDILRDNAAGATPGATYYEMKVRIDRKELAELGAEVVLTPGMPAEVYVMTGTRTFAEYLMDPITKSFRRAFREN